MSYAAMVSSSTHPYLLNSTESQPPLPCCSEPISSTKYYVGWTLWGPVVMYHKSIESTKSRQLVEECTVGTTARIVIRGRHEVGMRHGIWGKRVEEKKSVQDRSHSISLSRLRGCCTGDGSSRPNPKAVGIPRITKIISLQAAIVGTVTSAQRMMIRGWRRGHGRSSV
ncbi:hypothetical protein BO86DRAFT_222395 [Aspergillus japonicus CBS 114.51]|uniref:Uncharacterized protein n=2 Tax=Aspergillus TaxID=5052 RepID=A0A2V5HEL6_ASPV1|nr:hypothetical protein BO86DRAFT_222395 [Aspergillus japonicus CBS 114.51]PYI14400.1 hypothetical protein BO99DRAFT_23283 [Aspergillus violaceofuscus CBS 115571]RAH77413.1 hypothetical protein BO86DRAFT_222395 [Aspergillus japonicus CBS 114.51]